MRIKIYQINQDRDADRVKFMGLQKMQGYQREHGRSAVIDPAIYDEVFSGEVDCADLEAVYTKFNTDPPPLHKGHSLSMSDIVQVSDAPELVGRIRFYNDRDHFEELDYTDSEKYNRAIYDAREVGRHIVPVRLADKHIPSVEPGCYFCDECGFEKVGFDAAQTHKPDNLLRIVMVEPGKPAYEAEIEDALKPMQRAVGGHLEVSYPFSDSIVAVTNETGKLDGLPSNRAINGDIYCGAFFIIGDNYEGEFRSLTDEQTAEMLTRFAAPEFCDPDESMDSGIQMT